MKSKQSKCGVGGLCVGIFSSLQGLVLRVGCVCLAMC